MSGGIERDAVGTPGDELFAQFLRRFPRNAEYAHRSALARDVQQPASGIERHHVRARTDRGAGDGSLGPQVEHQKPRVALAGDECETPVRVDQQAVIAVRARKRDAADDRVGGRVDLDRKSVV